MSWDVSLQHHDADPDSWDPPAFGTWDDVKRTIDSVWPGIDWDASPCFERDEFLIEISFWLNGSAGVTSIDLRIRGGDEALDAIRTLADVLGGVRATDRSTMEPLDLNSSSAAEGLQHWRAVRDRVLSRDRNDEGNSGATPNDQ